MEYKEFQMFREFQRLKKQGLVQQDIFSGRSQPSNVGNSQKNNVCEQPIYQNQNSACKDKLEDYNKNGISNNIFEQDFNLKNESHSKIQNHNQSYKMNNKMQLLEQINHNKTNQNIQQAKLKNLKNSHPLSTDSTEDFYSPLCKEYMKFIQKTSLHQIRPTSKNYWLDMKDFAFKNKLINPEELRGHLNENNLVIKKCNSRMSNTFAREY